MDTVSFCSADFFGVFLSLQHFFLTQFYLSMLFSIFQIERVAQMGRTAPCWYDEHLLDIRLPNLYTEEPATTPADSKKKKPSKKKKTAAEKEAEKQVSVEFMGF